MDRASLTAILTEEALIDLTSQLVAIATVNFGADDVRVRHQPDEFVPIPGLANVARTRAIPLCGSFPGRAIRGRRPPDRSAAHG